jgi:PAS domain S-box-containing protein
MASIMVLIAGAAAEKTAEQQVAEQAALLDLACDAIMVRNADGRLTYWNRGAEQTFGWSSEEAVGRDKHQFLHTEFPEPISVIERTLARDGHWEGELVQTTRDGRRLTVASRWVARYDVDGVLSVVMAIDTDITDRKAAERRLSEQTTMLDLASDTIMVRDADGRLTYWNSGAERTFGWTRDEAIGQDKTELLHTEFPDPRPEMEPLFAIEGHFDGELVQTTRDGRRLTVASRSVASYSADGLVSSVMSIITDITEQKAAERRLEEQANVLRRLNVELTRSNEELEQFAYSASHDLSEPLRAISGPVSLLGRRYAGRLDPDADELIGFAVDGCARMQTLISDLLAYSSLGRVERERVEVDANALVATVLTVLGPTIEGRGAIVTADSLPTVRGEPVQLAQLFQNLISNAIKFTAPDVTPQIHIACTRAGSAWTFYISDNGIGIDVRHRDRIFKMFKRLHSRDAYPGTGIGLAVCKKVVERHGGDIGVDDGPAQGGSTFWFTLPTNEEHQS